MQQSFPPRDLLIVVILGEIVGLFGYAILQSQKANLPEALANIPLAVFALGVPVAATALLFLFFWFSRRSGKPTIFQFGKFAAVGFSNTAIDWGVLNLLIIPFGLATGAYAFSKALSFGVATLNSFLWNRFWSFEKKGTAEIGKQAAEFYLVTIGGLVINVGVATLVKVLGPEGSQLWAGVIAPVIATACSMVWNFSGYKFFVFKTPATS